MLAVWRSDSVGVVWRIKAVRPTPRQVRLVLGWVGDCLRADKPIPSRYVTSQLGQLSLASTQDH